MTNELRDRRLALAWHIADALLALIGLAWSVHHIRRPRLVETTRRSNG